MKAPTSWSKNPSAEANEFAYDDSTVAYDSSTRNYDGVVDADLSDRGFLPSDWEKATKTPTEWSNPQPKAPTNWSVA